ncbi:ATP-binding response regulator [Mucilaginibacter phyllosphaerae]
MLNQVDDRLRVLVVEDNPGDFALVQELIMEKITSPIVKCAKTFREAKQILADSGHTYSIVLLDLSLPDNRGEPLIQEMIALCYNIPVVVLTGSADFAFGIRSLAMGISDYLLKDDLNAANLYKSIVYSIERKQAMLSLEISEKRNMNLAARLNNALEIERSRFAREIHDEFGQYLSGFKMSLSALKKHCNSDSAAQASVEILILDIDVAIASIRTIANELRPVILDKLGLDAALEWLTEELKRKAGVNTSFLNKTVGQNIDQLKDINIFRICQEAFTNITRHAKASIVEVLIQGKDGKLSIRISDNGGGMGSDPIYNPLSMGLINMEERAQLIGAELRIESTFYTGTSIELIVNNYGT